MISWIRLFAKVLLGAIFVGLWLLLIIVWNTCEVCEKGSYNTFFWMLRVLGLRAPISGIPLPGASSVLHTFDPLPVSGATSPS